MADINTQNDLIFNLLRSNFKELTEGETKDVLDYIVDTPLPLLQQSHLRKRINRVVLENLDNFPRNYSEKIRDLLLKISVIDAQNDFYSFVKMIAEVVMPNPYKDGRHIQVICEELQNLYDSYVKSLENPKENKTGRLQVFLPPRSMKSVLCSILFPAWILGKNPKYRILLLGNNTQNAIDNFGRPLKNLISSEEYQTIFPNTQIHPEVKSAQRFNTTVGGGYFCSGGNVAIAGRGGDFIICDDLLSEQTAFSKVERTKINNNYVPGIRSRSQPGAAELIVNCVVGDSLIEMSDGSKKKIKDITCNDTVFSFNLKTKQKEVKKVIGVFDNGLDDIYEIKTENGEPLRCNANHPWFSPDKNDYVKTKKLKVGDNLLLLGLTKGGKNTITDNKDEAWLLGFMLGDGWTIKTKRERHKSKSFRYVTCWAYGVYEELNQKVMNLFKSLYGVTMKKTKYGYYRTDYRHVCERMQQLGVVGTSHTKRIPKWVFTSTEEIRESVLNGFIDADGFTYKSGTHVIGLCNENLVKDLKELSLSLGYSVGKINRIEYISQPPHSPEPINAVQYRINIGKTKREYQKTKITSIKKLNQQERVYDLTVEDNHNFLVNSIVSSNTRWHLDDISGFTMNMDGYIRPDGSFSKSNTFRPWKIISIPAILDPAASTLLRKPGDPKEWFKVGASYWPEWKPIEDILDLRSNYMNTEPYKWNALYMQNPVPEEGNIVKLSDWRIWKEEKPPSISQILVVFDTAWSEKERADYSAFTVWGVFHKKIETHSGSVQYIPCLILLYAEKGKWTFSDLCSKCEWLRSDSPWKPDYFVIEKKQSGIGLLQELHRRGFPLYEYDPRASKEERLQASAVLMQAGRVWVPTKGDGSNELKEWAQEVVDEVCNFPSAPHDDYADTVSMAVIWMRDCGIIRHEGYDFDEDDEDNPKKKFKPGFSYWQAASRGY